jgi:hypothetical protein
MRGIRARGTWAEQGVSVSALVAFGIVFFGVPVKRSVIQGP